MIIFIFVFLLACTLFCFMFATRSGTSSAALSKRVRAIQTVPGNGQSKNHRNGLMTNAKGSTGGRFNSVAGRMKVGKQLDKLVLQAGNKVSAAHIALWSATAGSILCICLAIISRLVIPACCGFAVGAVLPLLVLRWMRDRRVKSFNAALPETIDLIARSLRAGHSVSSALEIVADQAADPLAGEFKQVAQQQQLGAMFRETLIELAERVPSQDLHFLITAIMVQRENGGDLTQVLDRTAHVISERLRIAGEVRTYSAQGRLTGWILTALPIALLFIINIGSPGYSTLLFTDPTGRLMLYSATASIAIGAFTIRKIVDIKV